MTVVELATGDFSRHVDVLLGDDGSAAIASALISDPREPRYLQIRNYGVWWTYSFNSNVTMALHMRGCNAFIGSVFSHEPVPAHSATQNGSRS